jgi:hypothetical protein
MRMSKLSNSRNTIVTKLAALAALGLLGLAGCSSSSGGGSTPAGTYCNVTSLNLCYGYTNLTSDQQNTVKSECTQQLQGTVVSSCPTGDVGCCAFTTGGIQTNECFYSGSASVDQSACAGTWTAGSGGGGSDAGGGG